jgi:hypothetical protein
MNSNLYLVRSGTFLCDIVMHMDPSKTVEWDFASKYQFIMRFPCFTYIITGDIILILIVELVIQNLHLKMKYHTKRKIACFLKGIIIIGMICVFACYVGIVIVYIY